MKFLSQINVNTEYTLPIVDGTNGQVLTTDGNGAVYWGSIAAGVTTLDGLTDVILTSPSSGQLLRYGIPPGSGETFPVWYNFTPNYLTPSSSIDNLGDVTITSAASGQVLQWNGTAWVNATLSTVDYVSKVQHTVKAGVAITKGQAVYITTSDGTNMIAGLASNAAEATSSKVIGLAASSAAINDQIFVVTEGLIAGLNTSTATAGDPVWLGTNGNLIFGLANKPVAPAHLVYIGVVTRVQSNNGEIFVNVQNGFELNEIHDALIVSPTAGQLLRRDSDNLWKNWTPNFLTDEADTLATVTSRGATTTNAITVGGLTVDTSTLVVDATNNRVGIGTASPLTTLDVVGHTYIRGGLLYVDTIAGYSAGKISLNGSTNLIVPSGNVGVRTTTPQKFLDVNGSGIVASFGGIFSPGSFAGIHFGYSESNLNNDSFKKSAIVFERTDNHGQGSNASGKIHFLLNNIAGGSATSLAHSVMVIDTNSTATQGSARVGIGTTSPNSTLDVNGAANATSFSSTALFIANADTSGSLQPDQGSPANKIYSFRWAGGEQGYIDTDAKITFAGFKTPTGTASQFLKANGTVDSNVYITSAALSGYATQSWVNSNFYTQGQIDDFFGGAEPISGYNKSNWDTAYNDKVNSASFNTTNGILTLTQQDGGTVTVDLDGRYLTSDTDAQTLTWEAPTKNLSITNGNTITLEGLATEDYVLSQGFISSETDTLATVTARGATTSVASTFSNTLTVSGNTAIFKASSVTADTSLPTKRIAEFAGIYNSGSNGHQMFISSTAGNGPWEINQTKTWGGILSFGVSTNGTEITRKLYVTPDSVGVNVYPTSGDQMEVAGALRVHTGNNWDGVQIYADGQAGYIRGRGDEIGLHIRSEYGNVLLASDRGNVVVKGTSVYTTGGEAALSVVGNIISFGASNGDLSYFRRLDAGQFQWQTYNSGNNGQIHLQPYGGNVGIRTTNPSYPFEIGAIGADSVAAKLTQTYERVRYNTVDLLGYNDGHLWLIGNNNPSLVISSSWDWDQQVEINYTPGPSGGASGVLKIGQLTGQKNSATYTHGRTEFYVNGAVRSNINTYGVGIGREAASNQKLAIDAATGTWILDAYNSGTEIGGIHVNSGILTLQGSGSTEVRLATSGNATWNGDILATRTWVNTNFYNQGEVEDFFGGITAIAGYNKSNWDTAYNDKINSAAFNTTNGVLTLTQQDGGTVTVDLDGRYLTSDTDAQTLTWDAGSKTLGITNGNDVILSELATEDFVTSQGYVTSAHTHTIANVTGLQTALDGKVSKSGDTMTGSLTFADVADNVRLSKNVNWLNLYDPWGNLHLRNANSGYGNYIDGSVHYWRPHDGSSYWMTLNSTGLGIGTTNPSYKLDVSGQFRVNNGVGNGSGQALIVGGSGDVTLTSGGSLFFGAYDYGASTYIRGYDNSAGLYLYADGYNIARFGSTSAQIDKTLILADDISFTKTNVSIYGNSTGFLYFHGYSNVYFQNHIIARGGISNDGGDVFINDNLYINTDTARIYFNRPGGVIVGSIGWHSDDYFYVAGHPSYGPGAGNDVRVWGFGQNIHFGTNSAGDVATINNAGTFTYGGSEIATRSWVQAQGYITSETDSQDLTWDPGSKTLGITNGNSVVLENLATEDYVTSQGYITGYTETDTLATVTGRGATTSTAVTFNGNVTLGNAADLSFVDLAGTFPTSGKGFDWTLNNDGARIYAIQPSSDSIDLVFQLRDNATTNDRFVFHVDEWQGAAYDKYPLIISGGTQFDLKDSNLYTNSVLRLSNSGVLQNVTGNISMFTNDSGYITGYTETDTLASVTARGNATNASIIVQGGQGAAETTDGFGLVIRGNYTNGQYNHRLSKFDRGGGVPLYVQSTSGTANVWSNSARFGTYSGNGYEFEVYGSAKTNGDFVSTGQINASGGNSSQWNTAYGWGNHADAPYWNVSLTDAVQVEAQEVIFAGNVTIQGTLTESSSIRFKENIAPLEPSLDKVNQLEAISYNKIGEDNREIGLIAEDVAELFPEVVTYNEEGQPQGIQYQRLSVILLKAVQELTERVNKLENK